MLDIYLCLDISMADSSSTAHTVTAQEALRLTSSLRECSNATKGSIPLLSLNCNDKYIDISSILINLRKTLYYK